MLTGIIFTTVILIAPLLVWSNKTLRASYKVITYILLITLAGLYVFMTIRSSEWWKKMSADVEKKASEMTSSTDSNANTANAAPAPITTADPREINKLIEGLGRSFDIPVEEIEKLARGTDGKPLIDKGFESTFTETFGISFPQNGSSKTGLRFIRYPEDVPVGTMVRVPILVAKEWSRKISIVGWHISYAPSDDVTPELLYLFDRGTQDQLVVSYSVITDDATGRRKHRYAKIENNRETASAEKNWQGIKTVQIALPETYTLPVGTKGVSYTLIRTRR